MSGLKNKAWKKYEKGKQFRNGAAEQGQLRNAGLFFFFLDKCHVKVVHCKHQIETPSGFCDFEEACFLHKAVQFNFYLLKVTPISKHCHSPFDSELLKSKYFM